VYAEQGQALIFDELGLACPDNDEIKVLEPVQIAVLLYGICVHARMHEYMYTGICVHARMHMRACAHA